MITRVRWTLLGEWWCAPLTATEDEVAAAVLAKFQAPGITPALIKDRCYGGFRCEKPENRHFCFNAGAYTYTGSSQRPLTEEDRAEIWRQLIEPNAKRDGDGDNGFIGGGVFSADAPKQPGAAPAAGEGDAR